jgi:hypothetical protein
MAHVFQLLGQGDIVQHQAGQFLKHTQSLANAVQVGIYDAQYICLRHEIPR